MADDDETSISSGLGSFFATERRRFWAKADHWKKVCSSLTISDGAWPRPDCGVDFPAPRVDGVETERRRDRLTEDGYSLIDEIGFSVVDDASNTHDSLTSSHEAIKALADAIEELHKRHKIPATFILLYDEAWLLARAACRILAASTHSKNIFNFDMLAWYIDPREGVAGFSPHRDRQPENARGSFHDDCQAKYVTLWLALTDATPENSCLYVIPKQFDPGYVDGDDVDAEEEQKDSKEEQTSAGIHHAVDDGRDPLSRSLPTKESYQNIRALPRLAGQSVMFTHRLLHWGSRGNPHSHRAGPRIAISFVSSDPSFERPYIDPKYISGAVLPPFHVRLLLVCSQLLIYHQRFDLPKDCIKACYDYCKEFGTELEDAYRQKVFVEFVKGMKEAKNEEAEDITDKPTGQSLRAGGGGDSDDEDDAILEEMLDAEAGGYGDFQDDFDELEARSNGEESEGGNDDVSYGKHAGDIAKCSEKEQNSKKQRCE